MNRILYQLLFAFLIIFYLSNASLSSSEDEDDETETDIDIGDLAEAIAEGTSVEAIAAEIVDEIDEIANLDLETLTSTLESVIADLGSSISADELAQAITEALEAAALEEEEEEAEPTEEPDGDVVLVDGVPTAVQIGIGDVGFESGSAGILTLCAAVGGDCSVTQTIADGTTLTVLSCGIGVRGASAIFMAAEGEDNECGISVVIDESSGAANTDLSSQSMTSTSAIGAAGCLQDIADALADPALNCTGEATAVLPDAATETPTTTTTTTTTTTATDDCPCASEVDELLDACEEDCVVSQILSSVTAVTCGTSSQSYLLVGPSAQCQSEINGTGIAPANSLTPEQEAACIGILGEFVRERASRGEACGDSDSILDDDTFLSDDSLGLSFCVGPDDNTTFVEPGDRAIILAGCRAELESELDGFDSDCCQTINDAAATSSVIYTCEELEAQCVTNACLELFSGDASGRTNPARTSVERADHVFDQYGDFFCSAV